MNLPQWRILKGAGSKTNQVLLYLLMVAISVLSSVVGYQAKQGKAQDVATIGQLQRNNDTLTKQLIECKDAALIKATETSKRQDMKAEAKDSMILELQRIINQMR